MIISSTQFRLKYCTKYDIKCETKHNTVKITNIKLHNNSQSLSIYQYRGINNILNALEPLNLPRKQKNNRESEQVN